MNSGQRPPTPTSVPIQQWLTRAERAHQQGALAEAERCYTAALQANPGHHVAWLNLSAVYLDQGRPNEACGACMKVIEIRPDVPEAYFNLGGIFREQGRVDDALKAYQEALRLRPTYAEAHHALGVALTKLGNWEEAATAYRAALAHAPDLVKSYGNLGFVLYRSDRLEEAVAACRRALELQPDHVLSLTNLGNALRRLGRFEEARKSYRQAVRYEPDTADANYNLALLQLMDGDLRNGWKNYEWRWQISESNSIPRNYDRPPWTGQPLAGKTLFLWWEQGLGDTIQFARYAGLMQKLGARVVLECQTELCTLFQGLQGVDQVITPGQAPVEFDFHAPLMSLPGLLETDLNTIPAALPYLLADTQRLSNWKDRVVGEGPHVGLVWVGNPKHHNDHNRSLPVELLAPLLRAPGVRWYSLQKGARAKELSMPALSGGITDFAPELHDFADTAAAMSALDLVISVDTASLHLAGALGRPTWGLIPSVFDWRWMHAREDTPWYPGMRLFRQNESGNWRDVIARIVAALAD